LAKLPTQSAYIDGEVCAIQPDGTTSFAELQAATDHKQTARLFRVWPVVHRRRELMTSPLIERKGRLKSLLRRAPKNICFVDHVIGHGAAFYAATCKHDAEGIVSKRIDAPYRPGDRGIWRKLKCITRMNSSSSASPTGGPATLSGCPSAGLFYTPDRKLIYAGRAGTGMDEPELKRLYEKLKPLEVGKMTTSEPPPWSNRFGSPLKPSEIHWVKPKLVAQVRYLTWTADGLLRQVAYLGLREDKPSRQIVRDRGE
jgi:bifunctional non-homologous end joining protein LigD